MSSPDQASGRDGTAETTTETPLPPGPSGDPVVGSLRPFLRDPFSFYDDLAEFGDVVRWQLPGRRFTTLFHPDHVERVLVAESDRFERNVAGDFRVDFAPEGLLLNRGEQWRTQRTLMQPAFTMDRIRSYANPMVEYADRTARRWDDGQEVALNRDFSNLTLRILTKTLFDLEVGADGDDEAVVAAARAINERVDVSRLTSFLPTWVPTPTNRRYRNALADYRDRADELIEERRHDGAGGEDLLSILLRAEGPDGATLSEEEIRDNLMTFTFAGHETTSLGLTYAFLLLSQHDDVLDRLRREHEEVLGDESPSFDHVPALEYTEAVVSESMRLHPPAHIITRRAKEDAVVDGYRIPEGTIVTLPQFRIHVDDRFYDDPDAFRPERWLDGSDAERPEYAYFPFGAGPRHCIGMRFAMLEMQLVVAVLARRFDFELLSDPDPDVTAGGTHRPVEDVRVRLHDR